MNTKSQTKPRPGAGFGLVALVALCAVPPLGEAAILLWGARHGGTGRALRDGLDMWAGGFLARHGQFGILFDPLSYQTFLTGQFASIPTHMWSYPPSYLLLLAAFGGLPPVWAILAFSLAGLALLGLVLRLAGKNMWFILALMLSPAMLENLAAGQNAAYVTALLGGGLLLLPRHPRLAGGLIGLASFKPQFGLVLPLHLLRRAPVAAAYASLAAVALAAASLWAFGPLPWLKFWHITRPAMAQVLITGIPADFTRGLLSPFAAARPLGLPVAALVQGAVSLGAVGLAVRLASPAAILLLAALATPYLHNYDLLGASLAIALLVEQRLHTGFAAGEGVVLLAGWVVPGLVIWLPGVNAFVPLLLGVLLAIAARRGPVPPCDS